MTPPLRPELERVMDVAAHLLRDESFVDDLRQPKVLAALDHWTDRKRLPTERAEALFAEDYRVSSVFGKIRNLQEACTRAGVGVPLDALVSGDLEAVRTAITGALAAVPKRAVAERVAAVASPERAPAERPSPEQPSTSAAAATTTKTTTTTTANPLTRPTIDWEDVRARAVDKLFSLEPQNVARWWSAQIACILIVLVGWTLQGWGPDPARRSPAPTQ